MTKIKIFITALLITLPAVSVSQEVQQTPGPREARQWQVANASSVEAGIPYELHNIPRKRSGLDGQLGYLKHNVTLNRDVDDIGWVGHSGGLFEFRRANRRNQKSISPDETLALYNTRSRKYMLGSFGRASSKYPYAQEWSALPSYDWMVHDQAGADFALYNVKRRDYFVLGSGGNASTGLTWFKSLR